MINWVAQVPAQPTGVEDVLFQYGALGVLSAVGIWATYFLFKRQERLHDTEREQWRSMYQGEKERGDRMETALLTLHDRIGGELAGKLVEATGSMRETAELLRKRGDR